MWPALVGYNYKIKILKSMVQLMYHHESLMRINKKLQPTKQCALIPKCKHISIQLQLIKSFFFHCIINI